MAVHVVGNVCLDTTFRLRRFPEAGETLNAGGCTVNLGGKGANQALAAAVRAAAVAVTRPGAFGSGPLQGEFASLVLEETA